MVSPFAVNSDISVRLVCCGCGVECVLVEVRMPENSSRPALIRVVIAQKELLAVRVGVFDPGGRDFLGVAVWWANFLEDVDIEDPVGLGRLYGLGLDGVEDSGVYIDHTARRNFEAHLFQRTSGL